MAGLPVLETESFIAFLADNRAAGIHRAGYNGVASLIPRATGNNLFVPTYAGLNYEIIRLPDLATYEGPGGIKFEPRAEPMHVEQADDERVVLVQPETSHAHVSARIEFGVEEPCYLHQHVELTCHRRFCREGEDNRLHTLWASYMHAVPDRHIYMKPNPEAGAELTGWFGITKAAHDAPRMLVRRLPDERNIAAGEHLEAMAGQEPLSDQEVQRLTDSGPATAEVSTMLSGPLRFYYGLCHGEQLFLMMFRRPEGSRLAYSPCGGGREPAWSPAWDYILHEPDAQVGVTYEWDLCLVVKPYAGREDVLAEAARYVESDGNGRP